MKRWIIPSALITGFLLSCGIMYGIKSHSMDPLRNAGDLKTLLTSATEIDAHYSTTERDGKVFSMCPDATYHLPTTPRETARAFRAILLPSHGWKVQVYFSPWFSMGATKTDAKGNVICKVSAGDEGQRIDPKDPSKGGDRTYVDVVDPSNDLPNWRIWVYEHLHF